MLITTASKAQAPVSQKIVNCKQGRIIFISIDVLQFPHKSYLQNGYFFCVHVVAKQKLMVIRIFLNKQQKCT